MKVRQRIIDVHAHVIPGVDDGSRTMEESVEMLKRAADQGIVGVIATPHYSRRHVLKGLNDSAKLLQQEIRKTYPKFRIFPGQETFYHDELAQRLNEGKAYTMAGSQYVLVEFMPSVSYEILFQGIRKLVSNGYTPILAHMERYGCLRKKGTKELLDIGCKLQMNYDSIQGHWFSPEVRWCREQIKSGVIHFLGTDMHRSDYRPPQITEALKWLDGHIDAQQVWSLTYQNALRVIKKETI